MDELIDRLVDAAFGYREAQRAWEEIGGGEEPDPEYAAALDEQRRGVRDAAFALMDQWAKARGIT